MNSWRRVNSNSGVGGLRWAYW